MRAGVARAADLLAGIASLDRDRLTDTPEEVLGADPFTDLAVAVCDLRIALWSALADIARP